MSPRYDQHTPIGLYGSLPFLLAHGATAAAGMLWLNAADTYVDLWRTRGAAAAAVATAAAADARGAEGGAAAAAAHGDGVASHWMSEGGAIELLLLPGPTSAQVLAQLGALTGAPPLPPLWAQGYHQSHWNIRSQPQAAAIDANADRHGFPLDGLCSWLTIPSVLSEDSAHLAPWTIRRLGSLLRTLERRQSGLEACRGLRGPPRRLVPRLGCCPFHH